MRRLACLTMALLMSACASEDLPGVFAAVETAPVATFDDAADDPAIWLHPEAPEKSFVLGTDKRAGLYVYDLSGAIKQFLPAGQPNNVDLRQGVTLGDGWSGDLAVATDRADNTIALFAVNAQGVAKIGSFLSTVVEPYGLCMGLVNDASGVAAFGAYKTGELIYYSVTGQGAGAEVARLQFDTQLEGCVFDDEMQVLYVGEEARGVWRVDFADGRPGAPVLIDEVAGESGVKADVEGLALYKTGEGEGYLLASSQGNNSFAVYDRAGGNRFLGRFAIKDGEAIDGAEETDGIEATSASLGDAFPKGAFVVQDGRNLPRGTPQNFKIVDWREIEGLLFPSE